MGNLDPTKIAIVLIVALLVLGPEKLPGFTKQAGAWWGEFQRVKARLQAEVNGAVSQMNPGASPFTETFNSASNVMGGFVQSIFPNEPGTAEDVIIPRSATAARGFISPESSRSEGVTTGWGSNEAESGYHYGDPRLN